MSELGPDARFILDAARDGDEPGPADHQRVRAALLRRVGVGAAVVTASVASATTAKGAVFSTSSLAAKLLIVAGAVSLAASGGALAVRYVKHHRATEAEQATAARAPQPVQAPLSPAPTPPTVTELAPTAPLPIAPVASTASAAPSAPIVNPKAVASVAPSAKPDTLAAELALLGAAMSALGANDGEKALAILDEHAAKYPNGTLAEERNGARCIALCVLGRGDARAQAESFLTKHPDAPLRSRIEKACGLP